MDKRKAIESYFEGEVTVGTAILMIAGGIALAIYAGVDKQSGWVIALGIFISIAGAASLRQASNVKITDKQIDDWLEEDLNAIRRTAPDKTGTDTTELVGETLIVTGIPSTANDKSKYRKGADNILRFSPIEVSVFNFTEDRLAGYTCTWDFIVGKTTEEATMEYYYRDIVSVETGALELRIGAESVRAEAFRMTTTGGNSFSLALSHPGIIEKHGGSIPRTRAEKAVQTIRKLVREKKSVTQR